MPVKNDNGITLGPGTVYINGEEFGEISEVNCTVEPDNLDNFAELKNSLKILGDTALEAGISLQMAVYEFNKFCHVITGIDKHMRETCPNRKVVHLAYHARKLRTRKKNYRRMIRICEKGMN